MEPTQQPVTATPATPPVAPTPDPREAGIAEIDRILTAAENAERGVVNQDATPGVHPPLTPETPVQVPVTPEPAKPTVTQAQIERARNVGISPEEAAAFDPEVLERTITIVDRNLRLIANRQKPAEPAPAPPSTPEPPAEFSFSLDETMYDPAIVKVLRDMNEHYKGKMKTIEEKFGKDISEMTPKLQAVDQMVKSQKDQAAAQFRDQFDGWIGGLGEEFHEVLGKDAIGKIAPDSPVRAERSKVLQEMDALAVGYKGTGRPVPSDKELFDKAVKLLYGDRAAEKAKSTAAARVAQQLRDQRGQFVQRPSEIHSPDVQDSRSAGIAELRDIMRRDSNGAAV